jgi:hypothetical protein
MKNYKILTLLIIAMGFNSCQNTAEQTQVTDSITYEPGTFGYDLDFLKRKDEVIVLKDKSGEGQVIVSPKYQGKIFTSTANGLEGESFGWINYGAFDAEIDPHMNAYGGENRLWLGPEGGKFSIFFKPGAEMEFENWVTPPAIDTESWKVISHNDSGVALQKEATFLNYSGTELRSRINRNVRILEDTDIESMLGLTLDTGKVKAVGFITNNSLTNIGEEAWTEETGAPSLWILDMFNPSPSTTIVIPYNEQPTSRVATTDYFGEIPQDRISYKDGILLFKADGKSRGKLGIAPDRAEPVAGSYDAENNILTITTFDVDENAIYLNQEWTTEKNPLKGDAVNAYNDGPLEDGSQMGPFYEIESVSPAAFLSPGETLDHQHNIFHFTGDKMALDKISQQVLGISLEEIESTF